LYCHETLQAGLSGFSKAAAAWWRVQCRLVNNNSWRLLQPGMSRMKLAGARAGRQDEKLTWQTFFAFATSWQMMVLLYRASLPGRHLNFVYGRPEMWHSPPYSICGSTAGQV